MAPSLDSASALAWTVSDSDYGPAFVSLRLSG